MGVLFVYTFFSSVGIIIIGVPGHFVPGHFVPRLLYPRSLCPLATLSPVTLSPVTLSPVTLSPVTFSPVTLSPVTLSPVILSPVTLSPSHMSHPQFIINVRKFGILKSEQSQIKICFTCVTCKKQMRPEMHKIVISCLSLHLERSDYLKTPPLRHEFFLIMCKAPTFYAPKQLVLPLSLPCSNSTE
jgi:hypothetical protein